jgi:hypothetical protein
VANPNALGHFLLDTGFFGLKTLTHETVHVLWQGIPRRASECEIDGQPLVPFPPESELPKDDPPEGATTVTIRTFGTHEAAEMAVANLEAHGIAGWIKSDDCGGMYPNLTAPGGLRLLVSVEDAEAAVALLDAKATPEEINQIEAEAASPTPPATPPSKKRAWWQFPVGIVIGIILLWVYQQAKEVGTKTHYRYAKDGQCYEAWVYRNGHPVGFLKDRNLDGKWDVWTYYEHGEMAREEYDNNFDGKPDEIWRYSHGVLVSMEIDTDFNGTSDWFCAYQNDIVRQADIRPSGSKFTTTREFFQNGVLTEIWRGGDSNGNFKEVVKCDPFFNPISPNTAAFPQPIPSR